MACLKNAVVKIIYTNAFNIASCSYDSLPDNRCEASMSCSFAHVHVVGSLCMYMCVVCDIIANDSCIVIVTLYRIITNMHVDPLPD